MGDFAARLEDLADNVITIGDADGKAVGMTGQRLEHRAVGAVAMMKVKRRTSFLPSSLIKAF